MDRLHMASVRVWFWLLTRQTQTQTQTHTHRHTLSLYLQPAPRIDCSWHRWERVWQRRLPQQPAHNSHPGNFYARCNVKKYAFGFWQDVDTHTDTQTNTVTACLVSMQPAVQPTYIETVRRNIKKYAACFRMTLSVELSTFGITFPDKFDQ